MAKIHYCTCRVNLAGQNCHIVKFNQFNPLTWPEVQVLMVLHGEENVMDVMPVSVGEVYPTREKERLIALYGYRVVEACFPGRAFRMELLMTGDEGLPPHVEPGASPAQVQVPIADDEDDGETTRALAQTTAAFKPGRHKPAEAPKEA